MKPKSNTVPVEALAVELDLETASNKAFEEVLKQFSDWNALQPPLGPFTLDTGWHTPTPLMSQDFLRRTASNRKPTLTTIKKYSYSMGTNDWPKTGQALVFNVDGKMNEGQHRSWASLLGKHSYDTFIVTGVPVEENLFAYYDDSKPRSAADALYTSGNNGIAAHLAAAIAIHHRYENDALGILKQPPIQKLNNREVLAYSAQFPSLRDTGHLILPNFTKAVSLIGNKGVAIFFCDRALSVYGEEPLRNFLEPLGSGAHLNEDSPILGLRNRLLGGKDDLSKEHRLALIIKAFLFFMTGKKIKSHKGLYLQDNEDFPKLEVPVTTAD